MVYRMDEFAPEVKTMVAQLMITAVLMLMFICGSLTIWVYRSILRPLSSFRRQPERSGMAIWISPWISRKMMRSGSCVRTLRRCASV